MKNLVRKEDRGPHAQYPEIDEMRAALNRAGYDASVEDIQWAWEQHSDDWCAGWLILDHCGGADGAVEYLLKYLVEKPLDDTPLA